MLGLMIGTDLKKAAALLQEEKVVAIPTETVYGLAGNALSPKAVASIFEVKSRPRFDPLIIHIHSVEQFSSYAVNIPPATLDIARAFMPGPLTLLLEKAAIIPDIVTAGSPRVALRIPQHPLAQSLLAALDFPLAAPSANPFGYISPTTAQHVADQLGSRIPYILDGGPCKVGVESTILGREKGEWVVYRKGGLPIEALEEIAGPLQIRAHSVSNPQAPGMLKAHYAPAAPLVIGVIEELLEAHNGKKLGIISFRKAYRGVPPEQQLVLSRSGDYAEAAQRLFAGMRELDKLELDLIIAELLPEESLGRAINDRLKRAAA